MNVLALLATGAAWLGSFPPHGAARPPARIDGNSGCARTRWCSRPISFTRPPIKLCSQAPRANHWTGEVMNFMAGTPYASFERIRHMHIRHHVERVDLTCFDPKEVIRRHPGFGELSRHSNGPISPAWRS